MHELRLAPGARSKADVGAASLEVAKVRTGAHLQPLPAARRPNLHVELAGSREAQVPGAHLDDAMPQAEPPAHVLGVVEERFELGIGFVRQHELHHLDLVELMAALDAADVPTGAHLLATKTGRVGNVAHWQSRGLEDL